jgi:hypothetical protein
MMEVLRFKKTKLTPESSVTRESQLLISLRLT